MSKFVKHPLTTEQRAYLEKERYGIFADIPATIKNILEKDWYGIGSQSMINRRIEEHEL